MKPPRDEILNLVQFSSSTQLSYFERLKFLEDAHLLSQPFAKWHFYVHWKMFQLALSSSQWHEVIGQIPRLILAIPGSVLGKAPKGNVGSTKMGIFEEQKIKK